MRKGRVTIKKERGHWAVNIGGVGVAIGNTKPEAQMKANKIRKQQGKNKVK